MNKSKENVQKIIDYFVAFKKNVADSTMLDEKYYIGNNIILVSYYERDKKYIKLGIVDDVETEMSKPADLIDFMIYYEYDNIVDDLLRINLDNKHGHIVIQPELNVIHNQYSRPFICRELELIYESITYIADNLNPISNPKLDRLSEIINNNKSIGK